MSRQAVSPRALLLTGATGWKVWDECSFPHWASGETEAWGKEGRATHGIADPKRQPDVARDASNPSRSPSAAGRYPAPWKRQGHVWNHWGGVPRSLLPQPSPPSHQLPQSWADGPSFLPFWRPCTAFPSVNLTALRGDESQCRHCARWETKAPSCTVRTEVKPQHPSPCLAGSPGLILPPPPGLSFPV